MIPKKHTSRGGGTASHGGEHPVYCAGCGKMIKVARRARAQNQFGGEVFVQATQKCRRCLVRGSH